PPGQGGLVTLRLTCNLVAMSGLLRGEHRLDFHNANFTDRVGSHEITAVGDGATLVASTVPRNSVSRQLTAYPNDLLRSPLNQRAASLSVRPGDRRDGARPRGLEERGDRARAPVPVAGPGERGAAGWGRRRPVDARAARPARAGPLARARPPAPRACAPRPRLA